MYQHILVAIDGSSTGDLAVREAVRLPQIQHAQLRGVHVLEDIPAMYFAFSNGVDLAALEESVREAGQEALDRAVAGRSRSGCRWRRPCFPMIAIPSATCLLRRPGPGRPT